MKSQKFAWLWGLGPKSNLWPWCLKTTFGPLGPKKTYLAIGQEPWLQRSQTGPYFTKNNKMNTPKTI